MQRTYSDTPEPRYVEKAKTAENVPDVMKDHDSIKGIYAVDGGFAIDYKNGTTFHVPLEGTEGIIVDVDETNKMINIHLDAAEARNALEVKKQVVLTATEYAAITAKDPNTLYLIVG